MEMKTQASVRRTHVHHIVGCGVVLILLAGITGNASGSPMVHRVPQGIVGNWTFAEGSGTTAGDSSGNGNTATLVGGVSWTTGRIGKGLSFDGSSGHLTVPEASSLDVGTGSFSAAAWVKPSIVSSKLRVINKWTGSVGWHFDLNGAVGGGNQSGTVRLHVNDGTNNFDAAIAGGLAAGTWQHVAVTVDRIANQVHFYVNGISVGSQAISVPGSLTNTAQLWIGGIPTDSSSFFAGILDEAQVFNLALSASQVQILASGDNLVAHWSMNEGSGTSAGDSSGNNYNGTLTGGVSWASGQMANNALSFDGSTGYVNLGKNLASSGM
jgi:hypothetical protein